MVYTINTIKNNERTANMKNESTVVRKTSMERIFVTRNVRVDTNRKLLLLEKETIMNEVSYNYDTLTGRTGLRRRKLLSKQSESVELQLEEISKEELYILRRQKKPGFIYKVNNRIYYTQIDEEFNFLAKRTMGAHLCALNGKECQRFSAASDANGGCAKVRNKSKCMENYSWIKCGYETFGVKMNAFVVLQCDHYQSRVRDVRNLFFTEREEQDNQDDEE